MKKIIVIALAFAAPAAFAATTSSYDIGILGGLNSNTMSSDPATTGQSGKFAPTFGVTTTWAMSPEFGIGADLIMAKRKQGFDGTEASFGYTALQIPITARYTGIQYVNFGAGPYYSMAMGDITLSPGGGGTDQTFTFESQGFKKSEFGLMGMVRGWYPIAQEWNIVGDIRYLMGLSNQVNDATVAGATSSKSKDLQILAGVTYSM